MPLSTLGRSGADARITHHGLGHYAQPGGRIYVSNRSPCCPTFALAKREESIYGLPVRQPRLLVLCCRTEVRPTGQPWCGLWSLAGSRPGRHPQNGPGFHCDALPMSSTLLSCGLLVINERGGAAGRHSPPSTHWDLPKGLIDPGETPSGARCGGAGGVRAGLRAGSAEDLGASCYYRGRICTCLVPHRFGGHARRGVRVRELLR